MHLSIYKSEMSWQCLATDRCKHIGITLDKYTDIIHVAKGVTFRDISVMNQKQSKEVAHIPSS